MSEMDYKTKCSEWPGYLDTWRIDLIKRSIVSSLFVTWNEFDNDYTHSSRQMITDKEDGDLVPHLRGCIGTFSPLPIEEGLRDYALTRCVILLVSTCAFVGLLN